MDRIIWRAVLFSKCKSKCCRNVPKCCRNVIDMLRSVDEKAEKYVLALKVKPSDSIVRYREGDYNETVYIKGDGNTTPATPEEIIALSYFVNFERPQFTIMQN